jgi:hypothetical protein
MEDLKQVGLSYGILAQPLNIQLDKQGFKYNKKTVEVWESERQAINTLRFGSGLITDSMIDKIIPKLHKKIVQHVAKQNGQKVVKK